MSIRKLASFNSLWKGLEYYNEERVSNLKRNEDGTFESTVRGVMDYHVHLDPTHLKESTCTCPHGEGRKVICKHVVATYFEAYPQEALKANKDLYAYHDEENEDEYLKEYEIVRASYKNYIDGLSEKEVREFLLNQLINDYFDAQNKW